MKLNLNKKGLVGQSLIYTLSNVLSKSLPFLLLPFLTTYLTPSDYGIVAMFQVCVAFLDPFISINLRGAIVKKYYDLNFEDFHRFIFNCIVLVFASFLIFTLVFYFSRDYLGLLLAIPAMLITVLPLVVFFNAVFEFYLSYLSVELRPILFGVLQFLKTVVNLSITIYLVLNQGLLWEGRIIGIAGSTIIFGLLAMFLFSKNLKIHFSKKDIVDSLKFGGPLIFHIVGANLIFLSDRVLLNEFLGVGATGVYMIGYQISMILLVLVDSFNKAWSPWLYSQLMNPSFSSDLKVARIVCCYVVVILIAPFVMHILTKWFGPIFIGNFEFHAAFTLVYWISLGFAFNGIYKMFATFLLKHEKTKELSLITFIIGGLNVFLNIGLIPVFGIIGASYSTCISFAVSLIAVFIYSQKLHKLPFEIIFK